VEIQRGAALCTSSPGRGSVSPLPVSLREAPISAPGGAPPQRRLVWCVPPPGVFSPRLFCVFLPPPLWPPPLGISPPGSFPPMLLRGVGPKLSPWDSGPESLPLGWPTPRTQQWGPPILARAAASKTSGGRAPRLPPKGPSFPTQVKGAPPRGSSQGNHPRDCSASVGPGLCLPKSGAKAINPGPNFGQGHGSFL